MGAEIEVHRPSSEREIAEVVEHAARTAQALEVQGGGSRTGLAPPRRVDAVVSTRRLLGVRLYEPGALTMMVRAGTPLEEVERTLSSEGQQLAFEPMDHRAILGLSGVAPTIGGAVAAGASGPRRVQAGGPRDHVLGARFVNGAGRVISAGGRVMKNVTGYDLARLMAGSMGGLGVVTELCVKVSPKPEAAATVVLRGLNPEAGVKALAAALGSPFDVSGAAHAPEQLTDAFDPALRAGGEALTLIRIEGLRDSVAYRASALAARLREFGEARVVDDPEIGVKTWAHIRDAGPLLTHTEAAIWRLSLKPSDGPKAVAKLRAGGAQASAYFDWGGGLVWLAADEAAADSVRDTAAALGGAATLVRGSDEQRVSQAAARGSGPVAALEAKVRAAFDPGGVFSGAPSPVRPVQA